MEKITSKDSPEGQIAAQALSDSEARYRRLVKSVVDYAIFQLDPTGHITSWNTGAQRIKGYEQFEIIGKHFSRFYTDKDREAGVPDRALATAARTGKYEAEGWRVPKTAPSSGLWLSSMPFMTI